MGQRRLRASVERAFVFVGSGPASCFFSSPLKRSRNLSEISCAISVCTAMMSASLRLYCWPHRRLLSRTSTNSVLIERLSPC